MGRESLEAWWPNCWSWKNEPNRSPPLPKRNVARRGWPIWKPWCIRGMRRVRRLWRPQLVLRLRLLALALALIRYLLRPRRKLSSHEKVRECPGRRRRRYIRVCPCSRYVVRILLFTILICVVSIWLLLLCLPWTVLLAGVGRFARLAWDSAKKPRENTSRFRRCRQHPQPTSRNTRRERYSQVLPKEPLSRPSCGRSFHGRTIQVRT